MLLGEHGVKYLSLVTAGLALTAAAGILLADSRLPFWLAILLVGVAALFVAAPINFRTFAIRLATPGVIGILMVQLYDLLLPTPAMNDLRAAFAQDGTQLELFVEIFSGTVSGLYALIIAFMVFKSLQDHDNINFTLRDEAMLLDSMSQILPYLHDADREKNLPVVFRAHQALKLYAENILSDGFKTGAQQAENQRIIDDMFDSIRDISIEDENDKITVDLLMSRNDSLATVRTRRIAYMMERPSPFMVLMLLVLSVLTVSPFYLPIVGGEAMSAAIIGLLGFCISFLFVMMLDMSSHFEGYWRADRSPFTNAQQRIAARIERLEKQSNDLEELHKHSLVATSR